MRTMRKVTYHCLGRLVSTSLDKVSRDRLLAERLTRFEPVKTFDQDISVPILANENRRGQAVCQNALGDLRDFGGLECGSALRGHVDGSHFQHPGLQHPHSPLLSGLDPDLAATDTTDIDRDAGKLPPNNELRGGNSFNEDPTTIYRCLPIPGVGD
jgi:hypothetical protein